MEYYSAMYPKLKENLDHLKKSFHLISEDRKDQIQILAKMAKQVIENYKHCPFNFICTHNSRRSHIAQILAWASFHYLLPEEKWKQYGFNSGGTERTAIHPNTIRALRDFGFSIEKLSPEQANKKYGLSIEETNPVYEVKCSDSIQPIPAFSKKYEEPPNPKSGFLAVMTCDHAAENCPVVYGAIHRWNLIYKDPKEADGTPKEEKTYRDKVDEIGREMMYLASLL